MTRNEATDACSTIKKVEYFLKLPIFRSFPPINDDFAEIFHSGEATLKSYDVG